MEHRKELARSLRDQAIGFETANAASEIVGQVLKEGARSRFVAMMRDAADLLDPPVDDSTVEVRILARVDVVDGEAYVAAAAYPGSDEGDLRERVDADACHNWTNDPRFTWITARVPKPVIDEVEGTVES